MLCHVQQRRAPTHRSLTVIECYAISGEEEPQHTDFQFSVHGALSAHGVFKAHRGLSAHGTFNAHGGFNAHDEVIECYAHVQRRRARTHRFFNGD